MEYALIFIALLASFISMIVSFKILKQVKKEDTSGFNSIAEDATKRFKNLTDTTLADLMLKCQDAKDICECLKSITGRFAVIDRDMVRTFTYDAFMENEDDEQHYADDMLKYQTNVLIKDGAKILDSNISIVNIDEGTVHRVTINYLINPKSLDSFKKENR